MEISTELTKSLGAAIPAHIADQLRGKNFRDFPHFREVFWKMVGNDEVLSGSFRAQNVAAMKAGYAPTAHPSEWHLSETKLILHHVKPISEGGAVYDVDNLRIVTPAAHNRIHYGPKP